MSTSGSSSVNTTQAQLQARQAAAAAANVNEMALVNDQENADEDLIEMQIEDGGSGSAFSAVATSNGALGITSNGVLAAASSTGSNVVVPTSPTPMQLASQSSTAQSAQSVKKVSATGQ